MNITYLISILKFKMYTKQLKCIRSVVVVQIIVLNYIIYISKEAILIANFIITYVIKRINLCFCFIYNNR